MPSVWSNPSTVTLNVTNLSGSDIVADGDAVLYGGDTTNGAVTAGVKSIVITTGTALAVDDMVRLGDYDQELTVESYTASTKTVVFNERLDHDIPTGSTVTGRFMTYALDASVSGFDTITQVSVEWIPDEASDALAMVTLWQVLDRDSRMGGLQNHFNERFKKYAEVIGENWSTFENDAWVEVRSLFNLDGRNLDTMIVNKTLEPLVLFKLALLACDTNPTAYAQDMLALNTRFIDQLTVIRAMPLWDDANQDKTQTEDELQPAIQAGLSRGL